MSLELLTLNERSGLGHQSQTCRQDDGDMVHVELTSSTFKEEVMQLVDVDESCVKGNRSIKDYNDKYGHTAGDILLKRLADILNSLINAGDLISRYGGEEFAILLFETNRKEALDIAEKIRQKIESEKFWLRREETRATISIGIATFPVDAKIKNELIEAADRNLYKAKREGRNRVC